MYNPLTEVNLGGNIALALVTTPERELGEHRPGHIEGGGIYALYYLGNSPPYEAYLDVNLGEAGARRAVAPIYVGSSFAVGIKSGLQGVRGNAGNRNALGRRVMDHANKIAKTNDPQIVAAYPLNPSDFLYRALPLHQTHIGLAEAALITFFGPVWNGSGFGNHVPGGGRAGLEEPMGFNLLHQRAARNGTGDAAEAMRQRVRDQVDLLQQPDPNADIERFMSLIRSKLGIA